MPSASGALGGAGSGASIGSAFGPWGTAIGAGAGALIGALSGGKSKAQKAQEAEYLYWLQRQKDQEELASELAASTRQPAMEAWNDIYAEPGYNPDEETNLYLTPEEQAAQYQTPEEQAAQYRTPEERAAMFRTEEEKQQILISPEEEAAQLRRSGLPSAGAAERGTQNLLRYRSAAGGFAPGLTATIEEIQREKGRQASEAGLDTRLGILDARRKAYDLIAGERMDTEKLLGGERMGTAGKLAETRTGTAGDIAEQRTNVARDIGQTRLRGRQVGATGRTTMAGMDQDRLLNFSRSPVGGQAPPNYPSTASNIIGGAVEGAVANLPSWRKPRAPTPTVGTTSLPGAGYQLGAGGGTYRRGL